MKSKLKVLMATAEMAPFAKVGGLADVVSSLPPALKKMNIDVRIIMPLYGTIDRKKFNLKLKYESIEVPTNGRFAKVNIWQTNYKAVKVYFVEYKKFFGKKTVYDIGSNADRYMFFSQAALHVLPVLKFQPDVVRCHDYHTSMIPAIIKVSDFEYFKDMKTVLTIHNLQFQGKGEVEYLKIANLEEDALSSIKADVKKKKINYMRQGIIHADQVTTVSPTYAKEIMTKEFGMGLETLLRKEKNKVSGIVNGIDMDLFNPVKDKIIKKKFSVKSLKGKTENKLSLQKEVGLPQDANIPVVGLVSRLSWQKGLELITKDLMKLDCQFIFLGTGDKKYEVLLKKLEKSHPEKVSSQILFDINLAQQIYAASDMFLMPSRFEPCGLGQLIAMRYGTVPVVRAVGGLADTVDKFQVSNNKVKIGKQRGFSFNKLTIRELVKTLKLAIDVYNTPVKWKKIMVNGMIADFSWTNSAKDYIRLYKK